MTVLLVDDRDGRIVAEIETQEQARAVLDSWAAADGSMPDYLCLVEVTSHRGTILGTDTSVKIRPLQP